VVTCCFELSCIKTLLQRRFSSLFLFLDGLQLLSEIGHLSCELITF
jgi:hypothetical protein